MTPAPDALDRRRADLTAEIDNLTAYIEGEQQRLACLHARLEEVDVVRALMRVKMDESKVSKEKRRHLRAEVYNALTGEPQTVEELSHRIGRVKRVVVEEALWWHEENRAAARTFGEVPARWYRPDLLVNSLQEAAE